MSESLRIDPMLPHHELIRVLKAGTTYLFRQRTSGQLLVLKRMRDPENPHAAARRLRLLNLVHHPSAPTGYRSMMIEGESFTLRGYVEGCPASQTLLQGAPPAPGAVALKFTMQIALGLRALHQIGLVHGKLHPNNIILDSRGSARLVDLAEPPLSPFKYDGASPAPAHSLYLCPEQLRGLTMSPGSDLFCLGLILYQLLTGQHPFSGDNLIEVAHRTLYETPLPVIRYRPELPAQLSVLVDRLVAKRRYQRLASAQHLAQALLPLMREDVSTAPRFSQKFLSLPRWDPGRWTWRRLGAATSQTANSAFNLSEPALSRWRKLAMSRRALAVSFAAFLILLVSVLVDKRRDRILADEIATDIAAGWTTKARQRLQAELKKQDKDPLRQKLLGDVSCARKEYSDCLKHYREATAMTRRFSSDRTLQKNVLGLLDSAGKSSDLTPVIARLDDKIEPALVEGTQSEHYWRRWNSVRGLEARGASKKIDYSLVYSMDLVHGGRCETRRVAARKLGQLKDRRALPYLKRAQTTADGNFFERLCMGDSIKRAMRAIED